MGDLIRMPFSEVVATLEVLDRLGVTDKELAKLRSDKDWALQVARLLQTKSIIRFQTGVLDRVAVLGRQFAGAQMTTVFPGETLGIQYDYSIVKFAHNVRFTDGEPDFRGPYESEKATTQPTIGSEVVYLPDVVYGSLGCTFEEVKDKTSVQKVLNSLPKVEGLKWTVGNAASICRVLADLAKTGRHLLYTSYTWTTDTAVYQSPYKLRLVVGGHGENGVHIQARSPRESIGYVGLFVLGVPSSKT